MGGVKGRDTGGTGGGGSSQRPISAFFSASSKGGQAKRANETHAEALTKKPRTQISSVTGSLDFLKKNIVSANSGLPHTDAEDSEKVRAPGTQQQGSIPHRDHARSEKMRRRLGTRITGDAVDDPVHHAQRANVPKTKYTPLEQQVLALKAAHPGVMLVIEVGYKMRLFGRDAEIAADICKLWCGQDHNFMTTSFPVHRMPVYVRRLVEHGHKVGVVRQVETAAIKSVSDSKNKPFERKLVGVYTRATIDAGGMEDLCPTQCDTDGDHEVDGIDTDVATGREGGNYMVCITEEARNGKKDCHVALAAVEVSCGDVVFDSWKDSSTRAELEARLLLCNPCEILLLDSGGTMSKETRRIIEHFAARSQGHIRMETVKVNEPTISQATESMFGKHCTTNIPPLACNAMAALARHLEEFSLHSLLSVDPVIRPLSNRNEVLLSPNALEQLEILQSTERTRKGSLLWLMDHTKTAAGSRMFRHMLAHPLRSKDAIEQRLDAVSYLKDMTDESTAAPLSSVPRMLASLPDMEKGLTRILHGTASPSDFVSHLEALTYIPKHLSSPEAWRDAPALVSSLLKSAADEHATQIANMLLTKVYEVPARKNALVDVFADEDGFQAVFSARAHLRECLQALDNLLPDLKSLLGMDRLEYKSVQNQGDFLIEVRKGHKGVPKDWELVCSTKQVDRFLPPAVKSARLALDVAKEKLQLEAERGWKDLLSQASQHFLELRKPVKALAELDALLSLAQVARLPGYTRPTILADDVPPGISITQGRHPVLESVLPSVVPNDCELSSGGPRVNIITGPNMGGKSCFIRMTALIVLMAHVGSFVPAEKAVTHCVDSIFCRMGASDSLARGVSTFLEECTEAALILRRSTSRSLIIMDELGRGTSTHDGTAIAESALRYILEKDLGLCLFVTHYNAIAVLAMEIPSTVTTTYMTYMEEPGDTGRITLLYKNRPGVSPRSFGLHVAQMAGIPKQCVERATIKAGELEEMTLHDVADDIKGTTGSLIKFVAAGRADLDLLRNIQARIAAHLEEKAQPT